jgi:transcriptional regulator with XRE-family HTH domain
MKITNQITDDAVLIEIGKRITAIRINQQLTQADLARRAGVSKRTVERIESGKTAQLDTIIRIFRTLDLLPGFDQFLHEIGTSPINLLQSKGKKRQRASSKKSSPKTDWKWEDGK